MRARIVKITAAAFLMAVIIIAGMAGCRQEQPSEQPPIHLNPNMDKQEKYKAQGESKFFDDGSTMRSPVPGTVARGYLDEDPGYYTGKDAKGDHVVAIPIGITPQFLQRGRERYDIYCSPCHSRVGDGRGIMISRGYVPPPSFHQDYIRDMKDGYYFDVITNGVRNMPGYAHQIKVEDRWAIAAYLRALQRSRNAAEDDVPEELRETIKQAGQ